VAPQNRAPIGLKLQAADFSAAGPSAQAARKTASPPR
jgi:hypothetical protein